MNNIDIGNLNTEEQDVMYLVSNITELYNDLQEIIT